MMKLMLLVSAFYLSACATIVKSEKIPVKFVGGLMHGETQLSLPDGQYNLRNGQTTILVTRSKEDIPISVTCNAETRDGVIQTKYDATAGILGNIVFGGLIGMGIDAYNDKTYDPPEVYNISPLCMKKSVEDKEQIADQKSDAPRQPSSYVKSKY
ncbi:hypothetical protein QJS83_02115 [Bdellovibrio sp. 22V]|uniref:hypothetical protein n=1 Tax=Bdellovibrio TaxID=958 RepID=UPI0025426DB8|nr:hypothetical protein [Bdellovibrio sp. 22V]WII72663.1 hypothetical protein QJS83_02115 [Bdellovibrio sp. 22V]